MERDTTGQISTSLLDEEQDRSRTSPDGGSSATALLVLSTFIAVCGSYVFGVTIGYSSPAETGIIDDLGLSTADYSIFGSIMTLGAMLGAGMSGKVADFVGRKCAMGISDAICIMGWFIISFTQVAWLLDFGRLLTGCGVGLLSYVVPVYVAEITPKNLRGSFASSHQVMIALGSAMTYFIGAVVSWRVLAMIGAIPCLVQLLGLFFIPESPRWLAKAGKEIECEATLQRLRGVNNDISQEATEIREYVATLEELTEHGILELFQRIYARSLIIGVGVLLLQQIGGYNAIVFYASSIFTKAGFSTTVGTIAMAVVQIPMAILGVLLMDKAGRRPLLMISACGTCFGCLVVGISFSLEELQWWDELTPDLVFVGILVFNASFGLGLAGIPWLLMSEVFPINIKGSAGSLASVVNWLSSWVTTYIFNYMMDWSSAGTFFIFASIGGLTVLFVAKIVPETKGRTLEEIETVINHLNDKPHAHENGSSLT